MCRLVVEETGLLPHANAGALSGDELAVLRAVSASQGMMVESLASGLAAHRGAPDKEPARRLATLEAAGELAIPFTTGILVGIGDDRAGQLAALRAIAESHARHGHVQEVIVQNFLPKPGTAMAKAAPCPPEDLQWAIAVARLVLPPSIHVQAPPNLSDDLAPLLAAGIDDWGGVSPVTADHVNPERAWPALDLLRAATEEAGHVLAPRMTVYPEFALAPTRWLDEAMRFPVLAAADAEGLARDGAWCSGGETPPPALLDEVSPRRRLASAAGGPVVVRSPRSCPASPSDRRSVRPRSSRSSRPGAPKSARSPRWPTSSDAPPSATPSPTCATATSTTRTSARSSAASAPSRRGRSRSTCGARPTCSS